MVDPDSGTDDVRDLLIRDGRVAEVGVGLQPQDATMIEVGGLIVGPGFVDLHSHVHSIAGHRLQAMDGVTTALDLEAGLLPVDLAYQRAAAEGRPLNFGFSASWSAARAKVHAGIDTDADLVRQFAVHGEPAWLRSSTSRERQEWLALLAGELSSGALGIGVLLGYAPQTDPGEFVELAKLAATAGAPVYTHVRELVEFDPETPIDGPTEVVRAATETGAWMHHCHVNSTSRRHVDRVLALFETARAAGSRVSVEAYPYGAGSTSISAFFLAPERLPAWGLKPSDIVLLPSGERIPDERRLREIRDTAPGTACIIELLDEDDPRDSELLRRALEFDDAIVASDAMPVFFPDGTWETRAWPLPHGGSTHPRTAGTFAKTLRLMVRQTGAWSWSEAFRRCSFLPARVLDTVAPAASNKGHLAVGADADIVVLDPAAITDTATYLDPTRPSIGVRHLFVGGTAVVRDGSLLEGAFPGRALRATPR